MPRNSSASTINFRGLPPMFGKEIKKNKESKKIREVKTEREMTRLPVGYAEKLLTGYYRDHGLKDNKNAMDMFPLIVASVFCGRTAFIILDGEIRSIKGDFSNPGEVSRCYSESHRL